MPKNDVDDLIASLKAPRQPAALVLASLTVRRLRAEREAAQKRLAARIADGNALPAEIQAIDAEIAGIEGKLTAARAECYSARADYQRTAAAALSPQIRAVELQIAERLDEIERLLAPLVVLNLALGEHALRTVKRADQIVQAIRMVRATTKH